MKTFAWIAFFFVIVLFEWLYLNYPTPMLMGTVSILVFFVSDSILKRVENQKKILAVLGVVGLLMFGALMYWDPSIVVFTRVIGDGKLAVPNLWHGLVAAFVQYFMSIAGFWAWNTADIGEFLTKERL